MNSFLDVVEKLQLAKVYESWASDRRWTMKRAKDALTLCMMETEPEDLATYAERYEKHELAVYNQLMDAIKTGSLKANVSYREDGNIDIYATVLSTLHVLVWANGKVTLSKGYLDAIKNLDPNELAILEIETVENLVKVAGQVNANKKWSGKHNHEKFLQLYAKQELMKPECQCDSKQFKSFLVMNATHQNGSMIYQSSLLSESKLQHIVTAVFRDLGLYPSRVAGAKGYKKPQRECSLHPPLTP